MNPTAAEDEICKDEHVVVRRRMTGVTRRRKDSSGTRNRVKLTKISSFMTKRQRE